MKAGDIIQFKPDFPLHPTDLEITINDKKVDFTYRDLGNNTFEITIKE